MKRALLVLAVFLTLGLMIQATAMAKPSGTLRVALTSDPNSLDLCYGADRNASNAGWRLFNSLVVVNDDGLIEPALAETWEVSDGGKVYTMKLRQGVKFHNGEDFTADSVIFSWNRGKGKEVPWRNKWEIVTAIEKIDDFTIKLKLGAPYPLILHQISYFWNIVPEGYLKEVGEEGFADGFKIEVATLSDEQERAKLYKELQHYMQANPPFIYLYQPMTFEAVSTKVKNYKPRAAEDYYLKDVSLQE